MIYFISSVISKLFSFLHIVTLKLFMRYFNFVLSLRNLVYILYLQTIPIWASHISSAQCGKWLLYNSESLESVPHFPAFKHVLSYFFFSPGSNCKQLLEVGGRVSTSFVFTLHSWVYSKLLLIAYWWIGNGILICDSCLSNGNIYLSILTPTTTSSCLEFPFFPPYLPYDPVTYYLCFVRFESFGICWMGL